MSSPPGRRTRCSSANHGWTGARRSRAPVQANQVENDAGRVSSHSRLPTKAGPVPDRLTIWPVDDGRYGLDATFQGASGFKRAEIHQAQLTRDGIPHSFRQELNDGWTLRFGPLPAVDVASALAAFVY